MFARHDQDLGSGLVCENLDSDSCRIQQASQKADFRLETICHKCRRFLDWFLNRILSLSLFFRISEDTCQGQCSYTPLLLSVSSSTFSATLL